MISFFSFVREKTNSVNGGNQKYLDVLTVDVKSLKELQDNVILSSAYHGSENTENTLLLRNSPPIPLDPHYSESEDEWIRYVMDDDDNDNDTFHVICQCRCCDGQYDSNNDYSDLAGEDGMIEDEDISSQRGW